MLMTNRTRRSLAALGVSLWLSVVGSVVGSVAGCGGQDEELQTRPAAAQGCPKGVQPCSAQQVGLPCNTNNPSIVCSAQANGAYCCLAYAH